MFRLDNLFISQFKLKNFENLGNYPINIFSERVSGFCEQIAGYSLYVGISIRM